MYIFYLRFKVLVPLRCRGEEYLILHIRTQTSASVSYWEAIHSYSNEDCAWEIYKMSVCVHYVCVCLYCQQSQDSTLTAHQQFEDFLQSQDLHSSPHIEITFLNSICSSCMIFQISLVSSVCWCACHPRKSPAHFARGWDSCTLLTRCCVCLLANSVTGYKCR